jgi:hypothetical protein
MSTDWKALCAELVAAWDSYSYADAGDATDRMTQYVAEARAALAQPEPQGPSDAELDELWTDIDGGGAIWAWQEYARAVLARWGRRAIEALPND